jgi:hypothetical protein
MDWTFRQEDGREIQETWSVADVSSVDGKLGELSVHGT